MLALITEVIEESSNVKFGPELYCGPKKVACDVIGGFVDRVEAMVDDLESVEAARYPEVTVVQGDSRYLCKALGRDKAGAVAAVICSPPYPAEHDYTRNTRLELAFLIMLPIEPHFNRSSAQCFVVTPRASTKATGTAEL